MIKLLAGMALGLVLGSSVAALAADMLGSRVLEGWIVTKGENEICRNPDMDDRAKIIECD
jgi:hypothetical protein